MSIFKKLKDVLFEEEEYTEPIKIREEKKEEVPVRPKTIEQVEKKTELVVFDDAVEAPIATKISPAPEKNSEVRSTRAESERELKKKILLNFLLLMKKNFNQACVIINQQRMF